MSRDGASLRLESLPLEDGATASVKLVAPRMLGTVRLADPRVIANAEEALWAHS